MGKHRSTHFCKKQFHGSIKCGNNATPVQKVQRQRWWKSICDALKVSLALITSPPLTVPGDWDCGADKPDIKLAHGSDENFCEKHIFGLIWGQTFCSLLATLNTFDYSCRLLYLGPRGDISCTGRHTLALWPSTFGNMFYICFVSWQDIIGQVRLLYNNPLYAAVFSGAGYQFLSGFALV